MNLGTPSVQERTQLQSVVLKTLAKKVASILRCGLPGVITKFDPVTQLASVQLAILEEVMNTVSGQFEQTVIPVIDEILVMFPGDNSWCLTFPDLRNAECYVCFADMCINAWSTHGLQQDANAKWVPRKQEIMRRHDLSDGFAILAPRSQPNRIEEYSTEAIELRTLDNSTKLAMDIAGNITLKGDGRLAIEGVMGNTIPGIATSHQSIPIMINGTLMYLWVSPTP